MRYIPHWRWGPAQCKSNCEEHAGSDKPFEIPWWAAALNAIYKANQSANNPIELKIVLKLAHLLWPLEQKRTVAQYTGSPNFEPRVVNTRSWHYCPNMGSHWHPNMVKNANFIRLRRIWEFLPTLRGIMNLPPRQPRLQLRLPRWQ